MNQHEAVTKIANDAITHIRAFASTAIQAVMTMAPAQTATDVVEPAKEETGVVEGRRSRGRPREASVATIGDTTVVHVEPAAAPEPEPKANINGTTTEPEKYSLDWFTANLEEGRKTCRDLLSRRLQTKQHDMAAVRKEMMDITNRGRVTDFTAEDCLTYYIAVSQKLAEEEIM